MMLLRTFPDPSTQLLSNPTHSRQADSKAMDRTCKTLQIVHQAVTVAGEVVDIKARVEVVDSKVRDEAEVAFVTTNNNTLKTVMATKASRDRVAIHKVNRGKVGIHHNNNRSRRVVRRRLRHRCSARSDHFGALCPRFMPGHRDLQA